MLGRTKCAVPGHSGQNQVCRSLHHTPADESGPPDNKRRKEGGKGRDDGSRSRRRAAALMFIDLDKMMVEGWHRGARGVTPRS